MTYNTIQPVIIFFKKQKNSPETRQIFSARNASGAALFGAIYSNGGAVEGGAALIFACGAYSLSTSTVTSRLISSALRDEVRGSAKAPPAVTRAPMAALASLAVSVVLGSLRETLRVSPLSTPNFSERVLVMIFTSFHKGFYCAGPSETGPALSAEAEVTPRRRVSRRRGRS